MAYLIKTTATGIETMLVEMTTAQARKASDTMNRDGSGYRRVDARTAHRWVRDGRVHSTPLWIDLDNRIRR